MELLQSGKPVAETPAYLYKVHRFFRQRGRLGKGFCQEQGRTTGISGKTGFFMKAENRGLTFLNQAKINGIIELEGCILPNLEFYRTTINYYRDSR